MMKRIFISFVVFGSALFSSVSWAIELLTWERLPLTIPLVIGQERAVFLDKNVRVGMDAGLSDVLRVQSAAGTIYLKAEEAVPSSRLQVQVVETGEIILIDVVTVQSHEPLEPVRIVDARQNNVDLLEQDESHQAKVRASEAIPAPVALTRYAAQSLYAPLRTVAPVPGLRKVKTSVDSRIRLHPSETIIGYPLAAYKLGKYTVTAVKLVNTSRQKVVLDPRHLHGNFYAATYQHGFLGQSGTPEDTTVVYLITENGGLDKGLLPSSYLDQPKDDKKQELKPFAPESDVVDEEGESS